MTDSEALKVVREEAAKMQRNATKLLVALKPDMRRLSKKEAEKVGYREYEKLQKTTSPKFYNKYHALCLKTIGENFEDIYTLCYSTDLYLKYGPFWDVHENRNNKSRKFLIDGLIAQVNGMLRSKPRLEYLHKTWSSYRCGGSDGADDETLWTIIFAMLSGAYPLTELGYVARTIMNYVECIHGYFNFKSSMLDNSDDEKRSQYWDMYRRIALTELAIIVTGRDINITNELRLRREADKYDDFTLDEAIRIFNEAGIQWTNPMYENWVAANPLIEFTGDLKETYLNSSDDPDLTSNLFEFSRAMGFVGFMIPRVRYDVMYISQIKF